MKSQFRDIFLKTATFGFKEETGSWEIDIGVADELSVNSLNSYVIDQVKIFLLAFHQLCKPVEICYDIITVDPNGKVKQVKEGQIRLIEEKSHAQLLQELKLSLENSEESFFTTIFIDCDLCVFVTEPEDKLNEDTLNQVLIPRAAKFYFGYVMEPKEDDEEALIPSDGSVSFETSVDIWVEMMFHISTHVAMLATRRFTVPGAAHQQPMAEAEAITIHLVAMFQVSVNT